MPGYRGLWTVGLALILSGCAGTGQPRVAGTSAPSPLALARERMTSRLIVWRQRLAPLPADASTGVPAKVEGTVEEPETTASTPKAASTPSDPWRSTTDPGADRLSHYFPLLNRKGSKPGKVEPPARDLWAESARLAQARRGIDLPVVGRDETGDGSVLPVAMEVGTTGTTVRPRLASPTAGRRKPRSAMARAPKHDADAVTLPAMIEVTPGARVERTSAESIVSPGLDEPPAAGASEAPAPAVQPGSVPAPIPEPAPRAPEETMPPAPATPEAAPEPAAPAPEAETPPPTSTSTSTSTTFATTQVAPGKSLPTRNPVAPSKQMPVAVVARVSPARSQAGRPRLASTPSVAPIGTTVPPGLPIPASFDNPGSDAAHRAFLGSADPSLKVPAASSYWGRPTARRRTLLSRLIARIQGKGPAPAPSVGRAEPGDLAKRGGNVQRVASERLGESAER